MPSPSCAVVGVMLPFVARVCRGGGAAAFVARVARRSVARQYVRTSTFVCGQLASRGRRSGAAAGWRGADRVLRTRPRGRFEPRFLHPDRARIARKVSRNAHVILHWSMYHFFYQIGLKAGLISALD